jgi:hypothetical protein
VYHRRDENLIVIIQILYDLKAKNKIKYRNGRLKNENNNLEEK